MHQPIESVSQTHRRYLGYQFSYPVITGDKYDIPTTLLDQACSLIQRQQLSKLILSPKNVRTPEEPVDDWQLHARIVDRLGRHVQVQEEAVFILCVEGWNWYAS